MKDTFDIPSPCFVLEEHKLLNNLKLLDHVKSEADIEIILAFKGFSMWGAFPIIKKYVSGATASSLNEVLLCEEHMNAKAHSYCVAYEPTEFDEIVKRSSHITFNSIRQYGRFIGQVPAGVSVGMRVNPEWSDVETDLYNPSSSDSRLGILAENLQQLPEGIEGLHFHVLCESDSKALAQVLDHFVSKFGHLLDQIKWVNMGGGHLMTRDGYDVDHLIELLQKFKKDHKVDIILEPGSAFAWETGYLETTVLDVVENGGVKTAVIDASFTCHMPDCLEMPYRPKITRASEEEKKDWKPFRIGGVSCLAGDFLENYWFEEDLKEGDRLIFEDMMHYTMVKTTMFNGVNHPSIGIIRENGAFELVKEFGYKEYRNRLS